MFFHDGLFLLNFLSEDIIVFVYDIHLNGHIRETSYNSCFLSMFQTPEVFYLGHWYKYMPVDS